MSVRCPFCHDAHLPARSQLTCLTCRAVAHAECVLGQAGCAACGADVFAPAELRRAELGPWELQPGAACALLRRDPRDVRPLQGEVRLGLDLLHLERSREGLLAGSARLELPSEQRLGPLRVEVIERTPRRLRSPRERVVLALEIEPAGKRAPGAYVRGFRLVLPGLEPPAGARLLVRASLQRPWARELRAELEWTLRAPTPQRGSAA